MAIHCFYSLTGKVKCAAGCEFVRNATETSCHKAQPQRHQMIRSDRRACSQPLNFYYGGSQTAKEVPRCLSRSDVRPHKPFQVRRFMILVVCTTSTSTLTSIHSSLHSDTPGRVDKSTVLQAIQSTGQSYDVARETLKHVSVDASGKVELEDWVEVGLNRSTIWLSGTELSPA